VAAALLVRDRDEPDAGERKEIERIHVGRADDAEHVLDAMGNERLDESLGRRHLLLAGDGRGELGGLVHVVLLALDCV
jgi:hypothetical protein